jgi:hypothetical protein
MPCSMKSTVCSAVQAPSGLVLPGVLAPERPVKTQPGMSNLGSMCFVASSDLNSCANCSVNTFTAAFETLYAAPLPGGVVMP